MKYKTIEEFLSYYAKKSTIIVRRSGLLAFIEFVSGKKRVGLYERKENFKNLIIEFNQYLKDYMSTDRDFNDDLLKFAVNMNLREIPPLTAKSYIASVKEYFGQCGIDFSSRQLKDIKNKSPKGRTRTEEGELTKDVIKQLLQYTDTRGQALFLTLISSGMRIGEALQLNLSDLNIKDGKIIEPVILIRGQNTKTGEKRWTFINREAIRTIEAYLLIRENLRKTTQERTRPNLIGEKNKDLLFPFSEATAALIFTNTLKKAELEKFSSSIRRRTFHIHMFRKYFISQLKVSCPSEIVEMIAGHEGYLSDNYRHYTREQLQELYQKGEHALYINHVDINKIESKYEKEIEINKQSSATFKTEIEKLQEKVKNLEYENQVLRTPDDGNDANDWNDKYTVKMEEMQQQMDAMKDFISKLAKDEVKK